MNPKRPAFMLALLLALGGFILIFLYPLDLMASIPSQHMYILDSPQGLTWYCLDEKPYQDLANQSEAELERLVSQLGAMSLRGYLVEVQACNIDVLLDDPQGYSFAWRFSHHQTDSHLEHRHMTRGAVWIQYLSVDYNR